MDDYENDFEDFEDDHPTPSKNQPPANRSNISYGYQPSKPTQSRPRVNNFKRNENNDEIDDYVDDFEDPNKKEKTTANTKPLGINNKPDWLQNSNKPTIKPNAVGTKPMFGAPKQNFNNASKPFADPSNTRKIESISENRTGSTRRNFQANQVSSSNANPKNEYGLNSQPEIKKPAKKRDFSLNPTTKTKKVNLPKDYLDKYTKNNPVRDLENSLKSIKENIKSLQEELVASKSIPNDHKRQRTLQRINRDLRTELKKLSENSTTLCDELQKKHYKKKKSPKRLDGELELKIKDREIENADKQMANLLTEYNTVKKRIEQVGDYNYAVELKSKVAENERKIKENEKLIKEMEQDQKRRDIQMNRLVKEEKTEKMRRVDYKHSKLTYLQEKINELEERIAQLKVVKDEQDGQEAETKQKYEAMLKIGEHYGINEKNVDDQQQIFRNKLMDEYEQLARREKHLKGELESVEKQYKGEIKEKKRVVREMAERKEKVQGELKQVVQDILAKARQLDDLIGKMRGFGMGEDILNKWEQENKELIRNNEAY